MSRASKTSIVLLAAIAFTAALPNSGEVVVVTGATGRTGTLLYKELKAQGYDVRGTILGNRTDAQIKLDCGACTEAEGIYTADVTQPGSVDAAFKGAKRVAIAVGSVPRMAPNGSFYFPKGAYPVDVDFHGCNNQVRAAKAAGVEQVLLISSMGTTTPDSFLDQLGHGWALYYKLNAEAYLMASGISYTIVKPSGLTDTAPGKAELLVGHEDSIPLGKETTSVTRGDVANVLVEAIKDPTASANIRFDLSSDISKAASGDFKALFAAARRLE